MTMTLAVGEVMRVLLLRLANLLLVKMMTLVVGVVLLHLLRLQPRLAIKLLLLMIYLETSGVEDGSIRNSMISGKVEMAFERP
jgi:hypothetical protein